MCATDTQPLTDSSPCVVYLINQVPLFRDCSDGFMRSLVPLLTPEVVIPGDLLIREGEIGREMYLLRRGQLDVIAHGQRVASLTSGGFVGEVCLLWEGTKRTASVQAVTFCDVLVLKKEDFDAVVAEYPEVQRRMKIEATMRKNARTLQDQKLKGGGEATPEADKPEAGDRLRALVREGSLQLKRASGSAAASPAVTPANSQPSTPTPATTPPTTASSASATAQSTPQHRTAGSADGVSNLLQLVGRVREGTQGSEPTVDRRHTMPTFGSDGAVSGGVSVGRQKWQKLRLLTKGMNS